MGCYQRSQTGHKSDSGQSAITAREQPHDSRKTAIETTKRMEKQSNWEPVEKQVSKTELKKTKPNKQTIPNIWKLIHADQNSQD